jgi:hypothetical protein
MPAEDIFVVVSGKTENRVPIFSVLVKRTYDIKPDQALVEAEGTKLFVQVDEYYDDGNPEESTVKYENELTPYKIATDVVCTQQVHLSPNITLSHVDNIDSIAEHWRKEGRGLLLGAPRGQYAVKARRSLSIKGKAESQWH